MKKISYTLTLQDCENYVRSSFSEIPRLKTDHLKPLIKVILVFGIIATTCIFALFFQLTKIVLDIIMPTLILSFSILITYSLSFFFRLYFLDGKRTFEYLKGIDLNREIVFSEENIVQTNKNGTASINWSTIKDIYDTKFNYLIFISDKQALIIPKRIFETETEKQDFWELIQNYHNFDFKSSYKKDFLIGSLFCD